MPPLNLYILDGCRVVRAASLEAWGRWMAEADRHVAWVDLGMHRVSTVFLGVDHGYRDRPLFFETMVFCQDANDPWNGYCDRYETWQQAEQGHQRVVERLRQGMSPD